ncbi:hypothetical protein C0Q70_00963 [Pomacea canaliculata]|uniref:Uncharacterized protein n=1 Tax=Pomacea canaliculata TaxID=400727 RepID=A0A2T7PY64_POMCA|nr:hypothetical protein C0Q70_00963 [Pomacea canaliculata]
MKDARARTSVSQPARVHAALTQGSGSRQGGEGGGEDKVPGSRSSKLRRVPDSQQRKLQTDMPEFSQFPAPISHLSPMICQKVLLTETRVQNDVFVLRPTDETLETHPLTHHLTPSCTIRRGRQEGVRVDE